MPCTAGQSFFFKKSKNFQKIRVPILDSFEVVGYIKSRTSLKAAVTNQLFDRSGKETIKNIYVVYVKTTPPVSKDSGNRIENQFSENKNKAGLNDLWLRNHYPSGY